MRVKISALGLLILFFSDVYFDLDSIVWTPILMFLVAILTAKIIGMRTASSSVFLMLVLPALLFISSYVLSLTVLLGNETIFYVSCFAAFFSGILLGGFRFRD
ncbi:MAG: hypothetical protein GVY26_17800 [Bacteroidetes bacterium]|jgi:hypothetical protein|nr:hypothetical protein [Bacteroidota bacterium]